MAGKTRHVLGLSGGKDSTALAVFMRDRVPEMEYFFCDTGKELKETYEYLKRVEAYLGKPIIYLNSDRSFDHWLELYGNYLPSAKMRWCTRKLKIEPFEDFIGDDPCLTYVGIRADEGHRKGYISTKPNIEAVFPFKDHGVDKEDVYRILEESGLGLPDYYKWRTRSGCFFCFFQRRNEWVGLKEHHPELFEAAKAYEKTDPETGRNYTWSQRESLKDLEDPERMQRIKEQHDKLLAEEKARTPNRRLVDIFTDINDSQDLDGEPCMICHL